MVIRMAVAADKGSLERLAELDSAAPLAAGEVLIGELRGRAVAALAVADGRLIADPFVATGQLAELLRVRARQIAPLRAQNGSDRVTRWRGTYTAKARWRPSYTARAAHWIETLAGGETPRLTRLARPFQPGRPPR